MRYFSNYSFFLNFIAAYVLLTYVMYYFVDPGLLKYLALLAAISVAFYSFRMASVYEVEEKHFVKMAVFSALFILVGFVLNIKTMGGVSLSVKYFSIYVFFLFGLYVSNVYGDIDGRVKWHHMAVVIFIPLVLALVLNVPEGKFQYSPFEFKNGAARYFIFLSFFIYFFVKDNRVFILYIIAITLIFNTIGTLFAVLAALLIVSAYSYGKKNIVYSLSTILAAWWLAVLLELPITERLINAFEFIQYFLSNYSLTDVSSLEYGILRHESGLSETSSFFRLKHWTDLLSLYADAPIWQQLFGMGVGVTKELTTVDREPHNEYLRLLVEFGPANLLIFLAFNYQILKSVGLRLISIPLVVLLINSFSANVFGHFLPLVTLYFFMGTLVSASRSPDLVGHENFTSE